MRLHVIFAVFSLCFSLNAAGDRMRIAVMDLTPQIGYSAAEAAQVSVLLRSRIIAERMFEVVERSQINTILQEAEFQSTGCTDNSCAVEIGKILSVNRMAVGTVGVFYSKIMISVRIVEVESGKIILSEDMFTTESSIFDDITALAKKISATARSLRGKVKLSDIEALIQAKSYRDAGKLLEIYLDQNGSSDSTARLYESICRGIADENLNATETYMELKLYEQAKASMKESISLFPNQVKYSERLHLIESIESTYKTTGKSEYIKGMDTVPYKLYFGYVLHLPFLEVTDAATSKTISTTLDSFTDLGCFGVEAWWTPFSFFNIPVIGSWLKLTALPSIGTSLVWGDMMRVKSAYDVNAFDISDADSFKSMQQSFNDGSYINANLSLGCYGAVQIYTVLIGLGGEVNCTYASTKMRFTGHTDTSSLWYLQSGVSAFIAWSFSGNWTCYIRLRGVGGPAFGSVNTSFGLGF
ncbi:MAG: hypothetical protein HZC28_16950 [Spirochaetes bacterium]|nr:hypothetical protein [Spirochaetota bacterium]